MLCDQTGRKEDWYITFKRSGMTVSGKKQCHLINGSTLPNVPFKIVAKNLIQYVVSALFRFQ